MTTALIVVVLLGVGLAIVLWAARRKPSDRPNVLPDEPDTGWNDPMTSADAPPPPADPDRRP